MGIPCVVNGCPSRHDEKGHMFPKDVDVANQWKELVRNPALNSK